MQWNGIGVMASSTLGNSTVCPTAIQTNNKANTKAPHLWVLWEPPITGAFSSQMGP